MRRPRAFKRDASLGLRIPDDDKKQLVETARRKRRDTSNLALEYILDGLKRDNTTLSGPRLPAMS